MKVLEFSPGSQWLAGGMADGTGACLDTNTLSVVREWRAHPRFVQSLVFSDDGRWLATAGGDQSVAVWDWEFGPGSPAIHECQLAIFAAGVSSRATGAGFCKTGRHGGYANVDTGEVLFQSVLVSRRRMAGL